MNPIQLRSQYPDFLGSDALPVLEEVFKSEYEMHPSRREQLFKIVPTTRDIWQASELHDMPLFSEVQEGEDYSFERPKQGANKTLVVKKYGLGLALSEELVDDGKLDFAADGVRKLARSGKESQELAAMAIFNGAFDSVTSNDGQYLCDTDHALPSGGTYRNELATSADLSVTSLEQALTDFETQFVGDSGIIERIQPKILLVHPSNRRYAMELIGSELKADTSDNNMNSLKGDGLVVVSSPHLTDSDAWFLLSDKMDHGLRIVSRKPMETKAAGPDVGFLSDSILYKSRYREIIGVTHAKGIFGSPGA